MKIKKKKLKEKFICIIPARSGSKGIKNKNIANIAGKPLIFWSIKAAVKSRKFSKIIVSTDSIKIKKISEKYGAECPFIRPKKISGDKSHTIDTVIHAVNFLEKNLNFTNYDYIMILQPTSPLRTFIDINNSIKLFLKNKKASSLISVIKVEDNHPARMYYLKNNFLKKNPLSENRVGTARQRLKPMFLRNGSIYIIKKKNLHHNFIGKDPMAYKMPKEKSVNIDDYFDFKIANFLLKKNEKKKNFNSR